MCRSGRGGFSLIEVIFVLVILGIITTLAMQKSSDTSLYQARDQIISHMRYAQHLAMSDDKFRGNSKLAKQGNDFNPSSETKDWQKRFWQIQFHIDGSIIAPSYSIYSDSARSATSKNLDGKPMNEGEIARDPLSRLCLTGYNNTNIPVTCKKNRDKRLRLKEYYNISGLVITNECGNSGRFYFDYLGSPYCGTAPTKLNRQAQITLTRGGQSVAICVEPLTGYVHSCNN